MKHDEAKQICDTLKNGHIVRLDKIDGGYFLSKQPIPNDLRDGEIPITKLWMRRSGDDQFNVYYALGVLRRNGRNWVDELDPEKIVMPHDVVIERASIQRYLRPLAGS